LKHRVGRRRLTRFALRRIACSHNREIRDGRVEVDRKGRKERERTGATKARQSVHIPLDAGVN
jgi:hypothetical protein